MLMIINLDMKKNIIPALIVLNVLSDISRVKKIKAKMSTSSIAQSLVKN